MKMKLLFFLFLFFLLLLLIVVVVIVVGIGIGIGMRSCRWIVVVVVVVVAVVVAVVATISFIFLGILILGPFLIQLFGVEEASTAYPWLVLLAVGQLTNAFAGPVLNILNMTGYEKSARNTMLIIAVLNIVFNRLIHGGVNHSDAQMRGRILDCDSTTKTYITTSGYKHINTLLWIWVLGSGHRICSCWQ